MAEQLTNLDDNFLESLEISKNFLKSKDNVTEERTEIKRSKKYDRIIKLVEVKTRTRKKPLIGRNLKIFAYFYLNSKKISCNFDWMYFNFL